MWPWLRICSCLEGLWQPGDFFPLHHWEGRAPELSGELAVRRPSLQTEILSPALLLHSWCRQLSGPLEHDHGQVVSSSANIHEYLFSQDCAGHSGCYNSG